MDGKRFLIFSLILLFAASAWAQNDKQARQILDKTASKISAGGAKADFTMSGKYGTTRGSIAVKGNKFAATTTQSTVWFDGKTQWTYMKANQEVNISTPNEAQQQAINPYKFIYIYKSGYKLDSKILSNGWQIHLSANNTSRSIKEMYLTISSNYQLRQVKMKQSGGWTTINVSNFRKTNISDSQFRFNSKDYPNAEVIDLR